MCQEPTGLLWIGCLTGLIWIPRFKFGTSTPNINSQTYWPKVISHVMSGTIFFICSTSAISALFAALRISAWLAAPKRRRRGCRKKKEDKIVANSKPTAMNLTSNCLDKFLIREPSDCVEKPRDTQSIYRETCREGKKKFKTRRSVEFSRKAERCIPWRFDGWSGGENLPRQIKVRNHGNFLNLNHGAIMRKKWQGNLLHPEVQEIHKISKAWSRKMATNCSYISSSCTSLGESLFDRTTNLRPKSNGWLERPRREQR